MTDTVYAEDAAATSEALWTIRSLLEHLLYKLTAARLLFEAADDRFAPRALEEIEDLVVRLRDAEKARQRLAPPGVRGARLAGVVARAPGCWSGVLDEHGQAMRAQRDDILRMSRHVVDLAADALGQLERERERHTLVAASAGDPLQLIHPALGAGDAVASPGAWEIDAMVFRAAIGTLAAPLPLSLIEFLGDLEAI